mmetsp:Transcript_48344/g.144339  ORF Transcript_48344/g.144339 Transcript_48344/m.144339 type:complete len:513 (+) Transcript_48344:105-1643(+)
MECFSGLCSGVPRRRRVRLDAALQGAEARAGRIAARGRFHRPPRQLGDDYSFGRRILGVGRNGAVLQARCRRTGNSVAVKTLDLHGCSKEQLRELEMEVEVFLSLDHPHVARLLAVYEGEDCIHFVMERLGGGELLHRLKRVHRFPEQDAAYAVWQMLSVVSYLHAHGVVHRDLKLENFLLESEGDHLKLIDFGVSALRGPGERMSELVGTLAYVAPEALERRYTSQCDLWSLGVITFALLTGQMPFDGPDDVVVERIRAGKCADEPYLWRGLSASSRHFVQSLLTVDPSARLTVGQALQHPWLACREGAPPSGRLDAGIASALRDFTDAPRLRQALLQVMAWSLTSEEQAQVRMAFLEMDASRHGCVGPDDLAAALGDKLRAAGGEVDQVLEACAISRHGGAGRCERALHSDGTRKQEISYSTYLAAMLPTRIGLRSNLLAAVFQLLDARGCSRITAEDLQRVLGEEFMEAELDQMRKCCKGPFQDGSISFEQFACYMAEDCRVPPACQGG